MKNILSRLLKNLRESLFKPEAWRTLAGGGVSLRAGTTGTLPQTRMRPGTGAGTFRSVPAPLPGCIPFYQRGPGVSPPANFRSALRAAFDRAFSFVPTVRIFLFSALFASFAVTLPSAVADESFFKKGDIIALVGGEDMVAMSEYGYLELLLTRALPEHRLKFRNLAWEGDTVFEQRRDLNFPPLEAQLDQVGATVIICQFGQMESLGKGGRRKAEGGSEETRKAEIAEFIAAYEKLIARMSGGGKRRILLVEPFPLYQDYPFPLERIEECKRNLSLYIEAVREVVKLSKVKDCQIKSWSGGLELPRSCTWPHTDQRDGVHLSTVGQMLVAETASAVLGVSTDASGLWSAEQRDPLYSAIRAKNRLWFDYWRVQNWAFLAGDRTEQPSSRDHVDRTQRWFPAEREQFLPLIEAREQEIWALAAKLAQP